MNQQLATETATSIERVRAALIEAGLTAEIVTFAESTRTAAEAAAAVGCRVEQIVKSLVFRGKTSGDPVLVLGGGANRADEKKLKALLGEPIEKADADFVRSRTGFAIGGVAPCGHLSPVRTLIDEDLLAEPQLWAAAGTPFTVFPILPQELVRLTGGQVAVVKK